MLAFPSSFFLWGLYFESQVSASTLLKPLILYVIFHSQLLSFLDYKFFFFFLFPMSETNPVSFKMGSWFNDVPPLSDSSP